jgi:predicted amidohydrolase
MDSKHQHNHAIDPIGAIGMRHGRIRTRKALITTVLALAGLIVSSDYGGVLGGTTSRHAWVDRGVAIGAAVVFLVFALIAVRGATDDLLTFIPDRFGDSRVTTLRALLLLTGYALVVLGALSLMHVPWSRLLLGGALTGVFVGIAAQQVLGNIFAGLVLLTARPFQVGQDIAIQAGALGGRMEGHVTDMTLMFVELHTDKGTVLLPNTSVLNAAITPGVSAPHLTGPFAEAAASATAPAEGRLRLALLQSSGRPREVAQNRSAIAEAAAHAAQSGAKLLICPEMFLTGYAIGDDVKRLAESADGPSATEIAAVAERYGIAIAYGYPERDPSVPGTVHNSAQLIGPTGERLANYRKTHLFGAFEREYFTPGDEPVVQADLHGLRIGLLICYDVEFPENVRAHAVAGTDLLAVPTANMHPFEFVAERMVPTRAVESQLYVAYVNRCGKEGEFDFVGLSCLSGPDGVTHARAGAGEQLLIADLDPALLGTSRVANPYLADRRPELYR